MKKLFIPFLICLGVSGLFFSYSKRSCCFSPEFAKGTELFNLGSPPPPKELESILEQPFTFLGSGNQSFAFESRDRQTVLKLFKFHTLQGFDPYDLVPEYFQSFHENHAKDRKKKVDRLLNGLIFAENYNRDNAGILYIHFPPTPLFGKKVSIQDRAGRIHSLNLAEYVFVLQKKAVPLGETLKGHLNQGDVQGAVAKLFALYRMIAQDLKNGLYDQDHNVMANMGFVGETPIRIDFGKLSLQKIEIEKEIAKINNERILPWLKKNYPEFEAEVANALNLIQKNLYD